MRIPFDRREFLASSAMSLACLPSFAQADQAAKQKIRVGQIGVGHAHASKLAVYRASTDYEVVGIVEPDDELRLRAQSQPAFRDVPWMTQEELLNSPGLQAVLVETRVRDLLPTAEACVAAGKHIHLDKPAGESLPQSPSPPTPIGRSGRACNRPPTMRRYAMGKGHFTKGEHEFR